MDFAQTYSTKPPNDDNPAVRRGRADKRFVHAHGRMRDPSTDDDTVRTNFDRRTDDDVILTRDCIISLIHEFYRRGYSSRPNATSATRALHRPRETTVMKMMKATP